MATASITNTFVASTAAVAAEVNTNFTDLVTFLNNSVIHKDGSKAFTGNMDAGSNKIVNLTAGTASTDAASVANVTNSIPAGVITMYGGSTAPALWLLCDGSVVSRTTYSALFAVIGTAFNTGGEAATDFRLPDFQNRYPIGDSGTLTLGGTVGSNDAIVVTHTHTGPSHTHTGPSHSHTWSGTTSSDGTHNHSSGLLMAGKSNGFTVQTVGSDIGGNRTGDANVTIGNDGSHSHTVSGTTGADGTGATGAAGTGATGSSGSSGTNANRPASVVVNYIIRTGV